MKPTIRTNSIVVCAVLAVMFAGQSNAVDIRYKASGDWFATEAGTGGAYGWQTPGVPGPSDNARLNWGDNTVTLSGSTTVGRFQFGVDESGRLIINDGGSLTASGTSANRIGNNGGATVTGRVTVNTGGQLNSIAPLEVGASANGILTISGGTVNLSSHLWVGSGATGIGTIDINQGGTLNFLGVGGNGMLGLGTINSTSASGGHGFLNVNDGGVLNLYNIQANGSLGSIQSGSLLDVSGTGLVTMPGNFVSVLNTYIAAGRITGNDIAGNVQAVFDVGQDKTFLTAVPEPSTLSLITAFGLVFAFHRGRR